MVLFTSDHCSDCRAVSEEGKGISNFTAGLGHLTFFEENNTLASLRSFVVNFRGDISRVLLLCCFQSGSHGSFLVSVGGTHIPTMNCCSKLKVVSMVLPVTLYVCKLSLFFLQKLLHWDFRVFLNLSSVRSV